EARTISSPTCHWAASSTSMLLLPASAVAASLVQLLLRLPCRFSVPPESMMPRSPMPISCSPLTLSVSVIVALCMKGWPSLPISIVLERELAIDRKPPQHGRTDVEEHLLAAGDLHAVAGHWQLVVRPGGRIGPACFLGDDLVAGTEQEKGRQNPG